MNIHSIAILLALSSCNAFGITIDEYNKRKTEKEISSYDQVYVTGIGIGFFWANVELGTNKKPLLYCQPPELKLGMQNYLEILDDEAKKAPHTGESEIGLTLLMGLQRVFPCN